jgi:hypothetical protein
MKQTEQKQKEWDHLDDCLEALRLCKCKDLQGVIERTITHEWARAIERDDSDSWWIGHEIYLLASNIRDFTAEAMDKLPRPGLSECWAELASSVSRPMKTWPRVLASLRVSKTGSGSCCRAGLRCGAAAVRAESPPSQCCPALSA